MRRSVFIVICILLAISAIFSGCSRDIRISNDSDGVKPSEERTEDNKSFFEAKNNSTTEPLKQEETEAPAEPTPDPNIVQPDDIVFTGRECNYGELEDDGDILKLWYSEEYHILLQYILDSSEGISTMKLTSIEEFNRDMSVFEMPAGCIDLGTYDAEGEAFGEITDDFE